MCSPDAKLNVMKKWTQSIAFFNDLKTQHVCSAYIESSTKRIINVIVYVFDNFFYVYPVDNCEDNYENIIEKSSISVNSDAYLHITLPRCGQYSYR